MLKSQTTAEAEQSPMEVLQRHLLAERPSNQAAQDENLVVFGFIMSEDDTPVPDARIDADVSTTENIVELLTHVSPWGKSPS